MTRKPSSKKRIPKACVLTPGSYCQQYMKLQRNHSLFEYYTDCALGPETDTNIDISSVWSIREVKLNAYKMKMVNHHWIKANHIINLLIHLLIQVCWQPPCPSRVKPKGPKDLNQKGRSTSQFLGVHNSTRRHNSNLIPYILQTAWLV